VGATAAFPSLTVGVRMRVAALLGLQHKAAALVEVDAPDCAVGQRQRLLEDVGVARRVAGLRVGAFQV
jgi:hypothetical protein